MAGSPALRGARPRWSTSPRWWPTTPASRCSRPPSRSRRTSTRRSTCRACWRRSTRWPTGCAAASRPTPRRCSGCACSTATSSRSWVSPATSTTTTTARNSYLPEVLAHAPRHSDHAGAAVHRAGHAGRACTAQRRVVPRALPGQAAHAARRGRDRPVHRPVAVARGARRAAGAATAASAAWSATSRCRWACSCRPRRRATWSRACCAT